VWQETIDIKGPYNFKRVLERLSLDPLQVVDLDNQLLKMPLWVQGNPYVVTIRGIGTIEEPKFQLTGTDKGSKIETIDKVKEVLQWNVPLVHIHEHFSKTDLKDIFEIHYGTPLVLDFDPYSCLIKCIIHQQLNLSFAHKLTERFVKTYGFQQDDVWFYPRPEQVAGLTMEELRSLQFSGRKAEYTIGISQAIANGDLNLAELTHLSEDEIFKSLIKLKGIGPWTIQNLLMFGYGKPNLFPTADIGIQNALKKLYKLDRKPTIEEMETYKKDWDPYLSYASLYLWRSIENGA
jgi:DNA-3-methyladenine glycosylase II